MVTPSIAQPHSSLTYNFITVLRKTTPIHPSSIHPSILPLHPRITNTVTTLILTHSPKSSPSPKTKPPTTSWQLHTPPSPSSRKPQYSSEPPSPIPLSSLPYSPPSFHNIGFLRMCFGLWLSQEQQRNLWGSGRGKIVPRGFWIGCVEQRERKGE